MAFLKVYSRILDVLEKIVKILVIVLLSGIVLIMFTQSILRYVFHHSLVWAEELAVYFCIYCVMFGLCIAVRRESHLQVDVILNMMSKRYRALFTAVTSVIAIGVMVFFLRYAMDLLKLATGISATLPITIKDVYMSFPIGCVLVIIFSLENIVINFLKFKNNGELPGEEAEQ